MPEFEETKEEIEGATDFRFVNSHVCSWSDPRGGVFILQAARSEVHPDPTWLFVSVWRADEGDVETGEAESVGEIIGVSTFSIAYCPYCGEHIENGE